MKLFSNFDTQIKTKCIEENVQEYGDENVICLSRSGLFFFVKVIWPLFGYMLLDIVLISFFYYVFAYTYLRAIILVVLLISSPFVFYLIGNYIDYKMDFVVINPEALIEYNQTGVFVKKVITINEKSLKSVTVERNGFLYSMFDNGDLTFFSEGDEMHGDVMLRYVSRPEKTKIQIEKIMNRH